MIHSYFQVLAVGCQKKSRFIFLLIWLFLLKKSQFWTKIHPIEGNDIFGLFDLLMHTSLTFFDDGNDIELNLWFWHICLASDEPPLFFCLWEKVRTKVCSRLGIQRILSFRNGSKGHRELDCFINLGHILTISVIFSFSW